MAAESQQTCKSNPTTTITATNTSTATGIPNVIIYLSSLLQRVTESNDQNMNYSQQKLSAFHGLTRPTISIRSYLERIFKYANCSPSCFVVAYIYLDRFVQRHPAFVINSFNVHRLLITGVLVSTKFLDDMHYNNAFFAKIGGISTPEINFLEVDFVFALGFQLNVKPSTFHTYCNYLQRKILLQSPPPNINNMAMPLKAHCCFNEEDQSAQQTRLAV